MLDYSARGLVVMDISKAIFSEDGWDQYLENEAII